MQTYVLKIAYDGTNYHGWQIQPNGISIQQLIEEALAKLHLPRRLIAAGRTDSGVHALDQHAHFRTETLLDTHRIHRALNGLLPHDIRILSVRHVHPQFHANRSAVRKIYHYSISLEPYVLPFDRLYTYHFPKKIDWQLLRQAAAAFVGKHDFTSFANVGGSIDLEKNPYRTIYRLDVLPTATGFRLEFEGDGFFYKMVRNITGMLLAVATQRRPFEDIEKVFKARDRKVAERAAPAHGLTLFKVFYPDELLEYRSAD